MDIQKGRSKIVTLVPGSPMVNPVATLYDRDGKALDACLLVTPSPVSTTVDEYAGATRQLIALDSVEDVVPGLRLRVTSDAFGSAIATVSAVTDTTNKLVRLVEPLPAVPVDGDAVQGLDVTIEIPTTLTGELYLGYILELADELVEEVVRTDINVVRFPYVGPVTAQAVRAVVARGWAGEFTKDEEKHRQIAAEANLQIQARLMASGVYASRYWGATALSPVIAPMIKLVLAEQHGLRESGSDRETYLTSLRFEVRDRLADVLKSAQPYDADGDGVLTDEESEGSFISEFRR